MRQPARRGLTAASRPTAKTRAPISESSRPLGRVVRGANRVKAASAASRRESGWIRRREPVLTGSRFRSLDLRGRGRILAIRSACPDPISWTDLVDRLPARNPPGASRLDEFADASSVAGWGPSPFTSRRRSLWTNEHDVAHPAGCTALGFSPARELFADHGRPSELAGSGSRMFRDRLPAWVSASRYQSGHPYRYRLSTSVIRYRSRRSDT
jgi:hypothetical protein